MHAVEVQGEVKGLLQAAGNVQLGFEPAGSSTSSIPPHHPASVAGHLPGTSLQSFTHPCAAPDPVTLHQARHAPVFGVGEKGSSAMMQQKKRRKTMDTLLTAFSSCALLTSSATGRHPATVTTSSIVVREGSAPGGITLPAGRQHPQHDGMVSSMAGSQGGGMNSGQLAAQTERRPVLAAPCPAASRCLFISCLPACLPA